MDAREQLRALVDVAHAHAPIEVAAWFHAGVEAFEGGAVRSLDVALGLRGRGIELPPRTLARAARDAALRQAWLLFPDRHGETVAGRGRRFASWLADFEQRRWPRILDGGRPPSSALEDAARDAFAAAEGQVKVPVSWDRLRIILIVE